MLKQEEAYKRVLADLKNKIYKPVYLLFGKETYYIDKISNYIAQNVLTDTERSFNQLVLYGKEITAPQLIDIARRYPMMANKQIVIVREAQDMKKIEQIETYVKQPLASTVLVLCYNEQTTDGSYKLEKMKRSTFYKQVVKNGEVFESPQLRDNELSAWIISYLKEKNFTIEPKVGIILAEYLGSDLNKITHELDKLFTLLPEGSKHITAEHIEQNIGISKDYNTFELNKAITQRDILKANRILQHFAYNPNNYSIVVIINALFVEFSRILKLHFLKRKHGGRLPQDAEVAATLGMYGNQIYFVKDYITAASGYPLGKTMQIISLLREYDMRSKGFDNGEASHGDLLRELIFKILH